MLSLTHLEICVRYVVLASTGTKLLQWLLRYHITDEITNTNFKTTYNTRAMFTVSNPSERSATTATTLGARSAGTTFRNNIVAKSLNSTLNDFLE